jgi:tryptophanyl-tRNA synthetase
MWVLIFSVKTQELSDHLGHAVANEERWVGIHRHQSSCAILLADLKSQCFSTLALFAVCQMKLSISLTLLSS